MWIFTSKGFISIVPYPDDTEIFMVRARRREHLRSLFPGEELYKVSATKYWFRMFLPRQQVIDKIAKEMKAIQYPTFRLSLEDADYYDVCDRVAYDTELLQSPFSPMEQEIRNEQLWEREQERKKNL